MTWRAAVVAIGIRVSSTPVTVSAVGRERSACCTTQRTTEDRSVTAPELVADIRAEAAAKRAAERRVQTLIIGLGWQSRARQDENAGKKSHGRGLRQSKAGIGK
jgi:hypothetical protein